MFFVFYILVLINYVSDTSSYVLQRIIQDVGRDTKLNNNHEILEDLRNNAFQIITEKSLFAIPENRTNTRSPNLIINLFDKKLSDEMLSIKQNICGRDASTKCKNTKFNIDSPTLEIKKKRPAVDLISKLDENEENERFVEDFEFRHLLPHEEVKISTNISIPFKVKNCNDVEMQHNESKNKVVDLRSLSGHAPSHTNDLRMGVPTPFKSCTCSQSSLNPNRGGVQPTPPQPSCSSGLNYPTVGTTSHKCDGCTRTTVSFTLMPYYFPYQPNFYYPPNIFNKVPDEYLYYYDDKEKEDDSYSDDDESDRETTKKKKERHDKDNVVDIDYDVPRDPKVKWNTAFFEARPNKLVKDLIDDLIRLYPDSVIKKCYCSSSSNYSRKILSHLICVNCLVLWLLKL